MEILTFAAAFEQGGGLPVVDGGSVAGGHIVSQLRKELETALRANESEELSAGVCSIVVCEECSLTVVLQIGPSLR